MCNITIQSELESPSGFVTSLLLLSSNITFQRFIDENGKYALPLFNVEYPRHTQRSGQATQLHHIRCFAPFFSQSHKESSLQQLGVWMVRAAGEGLPELFPSWHRQKEAQHGAVGTLSEWEVMHLTSSQASTFQALENHQSGLTSHFYYEETETQKLRNQSGLKQSVLRTPRPRNHGNQPHVSLAVNIALWWFFFNLLTFDPRSLICLMPQ